MSAVKSLMNRNVKATLTALLLVAGLAAVNLAAINVVERYGLKVDITGGKIYELTAPTVELLDRLNRPVEICVFSSEAHCLGELKEVLDRFRRRSDRIQVRYLDPDINAAVLESCRAEGFNPSRNDLVVKSGDRQKHLPVFDLYIFDPDGREVQYFIAERQLASAIHYVTADYRPAVAFTDGHNEQPSQSLIDLFTAGSFKAEKIKLIMREPGDDVDIIVIADPDRDFTAEETAALEKFINRGKSIMIFLGPNTGRLDNLEGFIEKWGLAMMEELVIEQRYYIRSNPLYLVGEYLPHEITEYFNYNEYYTVLPVSRGLNTLFGFKGGIVVRGVIAASADAFGKKDLEIRSLAREEKDTAGPFILAATAAKQIDSVNSAAQAKLFVCGSSRIYDDELLSSEALGNREFLARAINWCAAAPAALNIPAKSFAPKPLRIVTYQAAIIGIIVTLFIPGLVFAYGLVVLVGRKRAARPLRD